MIDCKNFTDGIIKFKTATGCTNRAVADICEVDEVTIHRILSNKTTPGLLISFNIAYKLGLDMVSMTDYYVGKYQEKLKSNKASYPKNNKASYPKNSNQKIGKGV